ncbi:MAG: cell division protein FtsQ/DivIB, partial [Acidimicrobiales bacterium]
MTEPDGANGPTTDAATDDAAALEAEDSPTVDSAVTEAPAEDPFVGPRRQARLERAERRAAQDRATAIEQARREARRRERGQRGAEGKSVPRGAVRGLKVMLWTVLLAVVAVALGLILYFTPVMSARSFVVVGVGAVTREEVLEVAKVRTGTPLLQISTGQVADRVATIRRVASARVQREYPSTLRITIVERIPVVVKDFPDGPHLYDSDGVDFATAPPPSTLPYLDVANPGPRDPATRAALEALTALRPEVAGQVSRIAAPSVASITLTLVDGRTVIWGTTDRTREKADKLAALLTQPGQTYDVSSPDLPTVK